MKKIITFFSLSIFMSTLMFSNLFGVFAIVVAYDNDALQDQVWCWHQENWFGGEQTLRILESELLIKAYRDPRLKPSWTLTARSQSCVDGNDFTIDRGVGVILSATAREGISGGVPSSKTKTVIGIGVDRYDIRVALRRAINDMNSFACGWMIEEKTIKILAQLKV